MALVLSLINYLLRIILRNVYRQFQIREIQYNNTIIIRVYGCMYYVG